MVVKPERAIVFIRKIGNDVAFVDLYLTFLQSPGFNPFHRLSYIERFPEQNGTDDTVKIWPGYDPHKKIPKMIKTC